MKQDSLSLACAIIMAIAASISVYVEIYDQVEDTIQVVNEFQSLFSWNLLLMIIQDTIYVLNQNVSILVFVELALDGNT